MNEAAEKLEFERAARLRDRISALAAIQGQQGDQSAAASRRPMSSRIHEEAGQFCVEAVFYRACQNWGNRAYFPRADRSLAPGEVLRPFIAQFYADRPAPKLILLSDEIEEADLLAAALAEQAGHKVEIATPQRGEKSEMVADARKNAREALGRRLADSASQQKLLEALGAAFGMETPPRRVEVYDNSHIMGSAAIGAMIVAGPQGFMKTHYRTFNIKIELDARRRLRHDARGFVAPLFPPAEGGGGGARDADPEAFPQRPDLILIDGGRGQFDAALAVARRTRRDRRDGRLHRQGRRPQRRTRDVFRRGPRAVQAGAARPGALFRAAPARRGASLRHRHASRQAQEGICAKIRWTKSPASARRASAPCCRLSAPPRRWPARRLADLEKTPGFSAATARLVFDHFHDKG